ncbi:MAG: hypothetical protein AB7V18_04385 [Pyrinomonadaceae bacterium]
MKRLFSTTIVLTSVAIFATVLLSTLLVREETVTLAQSIRSTTSSNANAAPAREPIRDEFVPEFHGLPTFDELFPDERVVDKRKGKLIEIFDDGLYRQSEVVAKNGEGWLVLTKNGGKFSIQRSIALVQKQRSVSWPGDENDVKLSFKIFGKPVFALKDIRGIRIGPVATLFHTGMRDEGKSEELSDGYRRNFVLGQNSYILRTSQGVTKDDVKVAVLVLEHKGITQIITQKYHEPTDDRDIIGGLLWVGDLDGDNELDLYFNDYNEKGGVGTELHLSTYAADGKLVGLAADFGALGC